MRVSSPSIYTLDLVKCMWWKDSTAFWVSNNLGIIRLHTLPLKDGNSVVWQSSNEGDFLHAEDELKVLVPTKCDGSFLCFLSVYKEVSSRLRSR